MHTNNDKTLNTNGPRNPGHSAASSKVYPAIHAQTVLRVTPACIVNSNRYAHAAIAGAAALKRHPERSGN